jgi:hypothetical protein
MKKQIIIFKSKMGSKTDMKTDLQFFMKKEVMKVENHKY